MQIHLENCQKGEAILGILLFFFFCGSKPYLAQWEYWPITKCHHSRLELPIGEMSIVFKQKEKDSEGEGESERVSRKEKLSKDVGLRLL